MWNYKYNIYILHMYVRIDYVEYYLPLHYISPRVFFFLLFSFSRQTGLDGLDGLTPLCIMCTPCKRIFLVAMRASLVLVVLGAAAALAAWNPVLIAETVR